MMLRHSFFEKGPYDNAEGECCHGQEHEHDGLPKKHLYFPGIQSLVVIENPIEVRD